MKRLRIILQHSFIYYFLLFICLISYFISNNLEHFSVYDEFNNEKFTITNIFIKDYGIKLDLKGKEKIIGYLYYEQDEIDKFVSNYELGDEVMISGDVSSDSNNTVPDTFNYKKYLVSNKIYNVVNISSIVKVSNNNNIFYSIKNKLLERGKMLDKSYPYISSLIFGNNSYLDEDVLASYRENGVSHLFAISGLHISIFIGLLLFFLDKLKVCLGVKSFVVIFFLIFYMFLTNFSMSVLRGAIFTILLLGNKLFRLGISNVNLLLFTLSLILFSNPLNLNNVGLLYSFLVTLFLILYSDLINKKGRIYSLFMISFIAFVVSYPITVNNFNQVNFLSIIYNLFFVPYVSSLLLPFTLVSYVFPFLDNVFFFFVRIIEVASQFLNGFSLFKVNMCKMNVLMVVAYFVLICKVFSGFRKGKFWYVILLVLFFGLHYLMPFKSSDYVMFFDVGQGDSAIVNVNNTVTLIDTGGILQYGDKEYTYSIAKNKILPYFKANGIRKIDNLVLSHGDADHMKEAMYLVENFKMEKVIFNCGEFNYLEKELIVVLDKNDIFYESCIKELDVGDVKLHFLNDKVYDNENDNSSVIYTELGDNKFLFMGDAGVDVEKDILKKHDLSDIDILKVGHHGSKTSSDKYFIDSIKPKYSIISVGKNNRFGHPVDEVLDNLKNSKIYRTDIDGSVMFYLNDKRLKIETYAP